MSSVLTPSPTDALLAPAVMDIEASGFGQDSYPIEVGFVLPDGRSYCSLIRPAAGWTHWDPQAERVHHISLDTAIRHGRDVAEVAAALNAALRGMTLYCDGWAHDYVWLSVLFEAAGLTPLFRLENLRILLNEQQAEDWSALKERVQGEMQLQRHRASTDARVLQRTLQLALQVAPVAAAADDASSVAG